MSSRVHRRVGLGMGASAIKVSANPQDVCPVREGNAYGLEMADYHEG